jgi:hypothetical protein
MLEEGGGNNGQWATSIFEELQGEVEQTIEQNSIPCPRSMQIVLKNVCSSLEEAANLPIDDLDCQRDSQRVNQRRINEVHERHLRDEVAILEALDVALSHLASRFKMRESSPVLDLNMGQNVKTIEDTKRKLKHPFQSFVAEVWNHHFERGLIALYRVLTSKYR